MNIRQVEIIAHRGASYDAPENTLAAINLAWKQGANAIEIDVRLTRDHQIVVIHDDNTKRTGGKYGKIKKYSLYELRKFDVGRYKGDQYIHEKIPTLSEVLDTVPEGKRLFIEIKSGTQTLQKLSSVLKTGSLEPSQIVLMDFNLNSISSIKTALPQYNALWNRHFIEIWGKTIWKPALDRLISKAQRAGMDGLSFFAGNGLNASFINKIKESGMDVYVWTVNDPSEAVLFISHGVDGIMTDRPLWLRQKLYTESTHHG